MRRKTIGRKLALAVAAAVAVSAAVTSAVSLDQGFHRYVDSRRETLVATGGAFAAAIAAPMAAHDKDAVFSALSGIGEVPHLIHALARDPSGKVLGEAGYGARLDRDPTIGTASEPSLIDLLQSRSIAVVVPVVDGGILVGRLEMLSDAGDLLQGLMATLGANLAGAGVALVAGLAVASRLQRSISKPLNELTAVMGQVRDQHDYGVALAVPASDEVGVLIGGFNAMLTDIRERDAQLVRHRDRLEQDVQDRTRDLAVAKDVAEQANAAKSMFLATMSHEIRTPMNGLLVMAELLVSEDLPARSRRYAEVISKSGATLLAIINDVLDFSKIEAGKLETERVPVDVRDIVGTVVNLFYARAHEKGLDLAATIAVDVPLLIEGDPVRLQQVVSNLVNNALKFTAMGHVVVDVAVMSGQRLGLAVTDTGIGIAADKLGHIFKAFAQADDSTTRQFGGTGLGLAISNRLAKAMGGQIAVASQLGVGSTFTLVVPLEQVEAATPWPRFFDGKRSRAMVAVAGTATATALKTALTNVGFQVDPRTELTERDTADLVILDQTAAVAQSGNRAAARVVIGVAEPGDGPSETVSLRADLVLRRPVLEGELRSVLERVVLGQDLVSPEALKTDAGDSTFTGARLLVADDGAVNREVMREALRRFGIQPDLVTDGFEALAAAERQNYDLIFMDGSMPGLDGFEACRRLRLVEVEQGRPRSPVIAVTAHVVGTAAEAWREAGMDGVLQKPFTIVELDRVLSSWLAPTTAQAARLPAPSEHDTQDSAALLDPAILDDISAIRPETEQSFERRIFQLYLDHAPKALDTIIEARTTLDHDAIAAAAHALKSMSFNLGAMRVGRLAGQLEQAARERQNASLDLGPLQACVAATLAAIEDRLKASDAKARRAGDGQVPLDIAM